MFARKTVEHFFCSGVSVGWNVSKTLSSVRSVFRPFRSSVYSPAQRNVLPGTVWRPSRCTRSAVRSFRCSAGKSSPTTATMWTSVKCRAASAKYDADPPRASSAAPRGVYTVSSATEPTTTMLTSHPFRRRDAEQREAVPDHLLGAAGEQEPRARQLDVVGDDAVLVIELVERGRDARQVRGDALRLLGLGRAPD